MDDRYAIERFVLDSSEYGELADLIKNAFVSEDQPEGGTIEFTEDNFRIIFGSPYLPRDMFVRARDRKTGKVVGFLGGIPRILHFNGKNYRFLVPAWASVHPEHQRRKLALRMGQELSRIGIEKGFVGALSLLVPEDHGIDLEREFCRENGLNMRELLVIRKFIARVFDVKRISGVIKLKWYERLALRALQRIPDVRDPRMRMFRDGDAGRMYELMGDHVKRNRISVVWDRDDFLWYVQQPGVLTTVHEGDDGLVDGFLIAWGMRLAGFGKSEPIGWLDLVHTYRLSSKVASDLCRFMSLKARELGWVGLQTPFIPYFDGGPFRKARFVAISKKLIVGSFMTIPDPFPERIDSFYFDWR